MIIAETVLIFHWILLIRAYGAQGRFSGKSSAANFLGTPRSPRVVQEPVGCICLPEGLQSKPASSEKTMIIAEAVLIFY